MRPNDKHVCFIGTNEEEIAVNIDLDSITSILNTVSPAIRNIVDCETAAEIASIPVPALNVQANFHGCPTFLPAPWLVSVILSTSSNDPLELIVVCKEVASIFDQFHQGNNLFISRAFNHFKRFAAWAWGVHRGLIPPMSFVFDPSDVSVSLFKNSRLQQCIAGGGVSALAQINPLPAGNPPSFTNQTDAILLQLAHGITRQTEEAQTMNKLIFRQLDHNIEKDEKKKIRLKKLHPSVLKLILFASAEDPSSVPLDVTDSCERFINSDTEGLADLELITQFKNRNLYDIAFSVGLTQAV
jgi:hypothetical protein